MDYVLMVFSSITVANKAKKIASDILGYGTVVQLPPGLGIRGCSYCLKIREKDRQQMHTLAAEYKLKIRAEFLEKNNDGEKEYAKL